MSIRRRHWRYIPTCDFCERELAPEFCFDDAIGAMRQAGWKYNPETRTDACPDCIGCLDFEEEAET